MIALVFASLLALGNAVGVPDASQDGTTPPDHTLVDLSPSDASENESGPPAGEPLSLPLSSFELFTITDLMLEITMRPCHSANRPIMSSIKKYLFSGIADVPGHSFQHPLFFPSYRSLVSCLTAADETYSGAKVLASAFFPGDDPPPQQTSSSQNRVRREAATQEVSYNDNLLAQKDATFEHELSIVDVDLSFERFISLVAAIVNKTCSPQVQLDMNFLNQALFEVVEWMSQDSSLYKSAQLKYFHNSEVMHELDKCSKSIEAVPIYSNVDFDILE